MSLNWDTTRVKDWDKLTDAQKQVVVNGLTWCTIFVGINEVTEKNAEEFYRRVHFHEVANGALLRNTTENGFEDYFITREDVLSAVGLRTNAGPRTNAQFTKFVWSVYNDRMDREAREAKLTGPTCHRHPETRLPCPECDK